VRVDAQPEGSAAYKLRRGHLRAGVRRNASAASDHTRRPDRNLAALRCVSTTLARDSMHRVRASATRTGRLSVHCVSRASVAVVTATGHDHPAPGLVGVRRPRLREPRPTPLRRTRSIRHHSPTQPPPHLRLRRPLLPRRTTRPPRSTHRAPPTPAALPEHAPADNRPRYAPAFTLRAYESLPVRL
jgi:hypothetical protein